MTYEQWSLIVLAVIVCWNVIDIWRIKNKLKDADVWDGENDY